MTRFRCFICGGPPDRICVAVMVVSSVTSVVLIVLLKSHFGY